MSSTIPIIAARLKPSRAVWCAVISLILHSAVLIFFRGTEPRSFELPIQVTILPLEPKLDSDGPRRIAPTNQRAKQSGKEIAAKAIVKAQPHAGKDESASQAPTQPSPVEVSAKPNEANALAVTASGGREVETSSPGGGQGDGEASFTGGGTGNTEGIFSGGGLASGHGHGLSTAAVMTIPARYSDTPTPVYPETARREGREGRVLLRVLIDDQGETKTVEVSRSSGSDVLDQAATSAIRRWRFHPARRGDEAIASWVHVPIDFRLTDNKKY